MGNVGFNHRGDQREGAYRKSTIRLYASEPILSEHDFIGRDQTSWNEAITKWLSDFAEKEFPRMNRIILGSLQQIEDKLAGRGETNP